MKKIRAFLIGTITVFILLVSAFSAFRILQAILINPNYDTTPLSNIGFVILVALGNACFSWARAFTDEKDKRLVTKLNGQGGHSMFAAIAFAAGSVTKYLMLNGEKNHINAVFSYEVDKKILLLACIISFVIALMFTFYIIFSILLVYQTIIREKLKTDNKDKNNTPMKLTLGFSPCPNDTFIFDALIHHKIDTEGLEFEVFYDDVETLNQKAMRGELDITKLSYHAFAYVANKYVLLDSGSALGFGVGPMLICKDAPQALHAQLTSDNPQLKIGIPGKYTTANFLLSLAFPNATNKQELVFSDIEHALLDGRIDVGLIIHENRFTYQDKGLKKILDLGDYWEKQTGCAIPLGGIVANRNLPSDVQHKVNRILRRSVEFAFADPKSGLEFIRSHAQEMSEEVMYKHIELYVNKYSVDLGEEGKKAIQLMFDTAKEKNIIPEIKESLFLNV